VAGAASKIGVLVEGRTEPAAWARVSSPLAAAGRHSRRAQAHGSEHVASCRVQPVPALSAGRHGSRFSSPSANWARCHWHRSAHAQPAGQSTPSSGTDPRLGRTAKLYNFRKSPKTARTGQALAPLPQSSLSRLLASASCEWLIAVGRECLPKTSAKGDTSETHRRRMGDTSETAKERIHHCTRPRMRRRQNALASACPMLAPPARRHDDARRTNANSV